MGALVSCGVSAISACFCSAAGSAVGQVGNSRAPRVPYMLLMFISIVISLFLKYFGSTAFIHTAIFQASICTSTACTGNQAVLRMTFALAIFFGLTFMMSFGTVRTGKFFGFQVILLAALMVMSFFLQNSVFTVWAGIARFLSAIFLVIQLMLIIDFAYNWNESWVAKDKKEYYAAILGVSVVMIIISIVFWGLFYKWFGNNSSCDLEKFFISFTIILCVGTILLAISAFVQKGGILPSAFVCLYSTYLLFVALRNDNNGTCNTLLDTNTSLSSSAVLGLIIAAGSIVYSTWSVGTSESFVERSPTSGTPLVKDDSNVDKEKEKVEQKKDLEADDAPISDEEYLVLKKQNIFFHAILILASAYAGMLLTNWGVQLNDSSTGFNTAGPQTMWVNIASQWFNIGLFLWTLLAPRCCPGRTWE